MDTPLGALTLIASERGLRAVLFSGERPGRVPVGAAEGAGPAADRILADAVRQLEEYFDGARRDFDLPLDPRTEFQQRAGRCCAQYHTARLFHTARRPRGSAIATRPGPWAPPTGGTRSASSCRATGWWEVRGS
jgi:hypothetical protein